MKTHLSLIFFIVLFSSSVHAQQGNTRSYPIEVGTYNSEFDYSDSQNTEDFTNNYTGRPSNDVFYKFTINTRMKVIMKHCESELSDTYLSLLDASGKLIDYNDDADFSMGCGGGAGEAYLSKILDAGTYYVVAEGYEENGVITTQITGMFLSSEGDSQQNAIDAGTYNKSFDYSDIQNMNLFSNQITHEVSGLPFGTLMGGVMAEVDDDPNTSFLDGMWSGAKMSFMTSGLSAVGAAANYSLDHKVDIWTGISDQSKQIQQTAAQLGLRSAQQSVKQDIVDMYYEQMKNGTFSDKSGAAGFYHEGVRTITDGNHRMNAAIRYYLSTGNDKFVNSLLNNGNFTINNPKNYGYRSYSFPIAR